MSVLRKTAPRVVIFLYRTNAEAYLTDWQWMETHPLGGTESSALHVASALQDHGYAVQVTNDFRALGGGCDIFISTRGWEIFARKIRPGKLNYLWCTDDADQPIVAGLRDPTVAAAVYDTVDGVMVLSRYQESRWAQQLDLPASKAFLTGNGIPANRFILTEEDLGRRPPHAYYGSTPFRGLHLLLERWPRIRQAVTEAELHVFSSMQIYGQDDPPEVTTLLAQARQNPGIHVHGAQGQQTIRATIRHCRALAYPCIFPETSCITAMEAMASGCAVVASAIGALPETAAGNPLIAPGADWLDRWEQELVAVLTDDQHSRRIAQHNLGFTRQRDWSEVTKQWIRRFEHDAAASGRLKLANAVVSV